jgi:hypothetical protein
MHGRAAAGQLTRSRLVRFEMIFHSRAREESFEIEASVRFVEESIYRAVQQPDWWIDSLNDMSIIIS